MEREGITKCQRNLAQNGADLSSLLFQNVRIQDSIYYSQESGRHQDRAVKRGKVARLD